MSRLRTSMIIASLAILTTACGGDTGDVVNGKVVYENKCAACHGVNGGGFDESGFAEASSMEDALAELTDEQISTVILEGADRMPPVSLTAEEVDDVLAYVNDAFAGVGTSDTE